MPKFESSIKVSGIESLTGNSTLLHLGPDNRVGIGTTAPETKLHVDGTVTAAGLIVPPGVLSDQGDSAAAFSFNPNFTEWNGPPENSPYVANGYFQDDATTGRVIKSSDSNLGGASAKFDGVDARWYREVQFESPLYANVFVQGTMSYKYESYSSGEPGLAITLTSRPKACTEYTEMTNTFIVPTLSENRETATGWQTVTWRAHTPGNREITHLKVEVISTTDQKYNAETEEGVHNDGGAGPSLTLGGGTGYSWYLDGFSLQFMHPDMRIDQFGRITGAYIAAATIDDLHIKDMISSKSSLVQREGTALYIHGEVANASYANGWSISKSGKIKATDIEIYAGDGTLLIDGNAQDGDGHYNPFANWTGRTLADLDSDAHSRLYGLSFEESNKTDLFLKTGHRATTGLDSDTIGTNDFSLYIANSAGTTLPASGTGSTQLSNGSITFNGITSNAPPGSIFTDGKSVVRSLRGSSDGTAAYILFLANTQKWDSNHGAQQKYHANTLLGEYGLYVIGKPTVGGWLYHPHANNTWYTIDDVQQGERLHLKDFITVGKVGTDDQGKIIDSLTKLESPRALDSITSDDSAGSFPPIGIPAGGILFADIHPNQWNHSANNGEVQLTNQRNTPNTRFTFIHPTSGTRYVANSSQGILTSLEDFPGSRYITFIGGDKTRGFTFDYEGHSPDFVAAFPLGDRWYYNQDEGKMSEFIPNPDIDCIVARVDSNGASYSGDGASKITQVYRYSDREAVTSEGASLSDLIIDPPRGMASGGLVLASLDINKEFKKSDNTYPSNSGFVAITNDENNPRNEFYVIHPDNGNNWLMDSVGRGVATSLNPDNDIYGTRHIAFVGGDNRSLGSYTPRFPSIASHDNVANDFIAVAKYDNNGNPRPDGKWYYDPGTGISDSHTFTPIANDFIIATINSYNPDTDGIDQITRWAAEEGRLIIAGVPTTITSVRNLLNQRIDTVNTVAQTAISDAQNAFANAVAAQANTQQALGLLDGAITVHFEEEDASRNFANADVGSFDYNDLWINVSTYNQAIDGSWYANAIFRYSNSLGGWADTGGTESGTGHTNKLAWRHDPNNPAGRAHLIGLSARDFADRSTTIYFNDRIESGGYTYGPNVAVIEFTGNYVTNKLNFNPEGDLWYDTQDNDNRPYVYKTNTTFSRSNTSHSGYANGIATLGEWSQTVYGSVGGFTSDSPTGWYNTQDKSFTEANDDTARDLANTALELAANSMYAADREILAFFQDTPPPSSTGNGDVWIHTGTAIDSATGTKNLNAIFVANTTNPSGYTYTAGGGTSGFDPARYWHKAPNNAIGLMYLESYSAGVGGSFEHGTNFMPRGYSLFDSPLHDYKIKETSTASATVAQNITEPYPIDFGTSQVANVAIERGRTSNSFMQDDSGVGSSLRIERSGTSAQYFIMARGSEYGNETHASHNQKFRIQIPKGNRFIFSYYVRANTVASTKGGAGSTTTFPRFYVSNSTHNHAGGIWTPSSESKLITQADTWERQEWVLDFSTDDTLTTGTGSSFTGPATEITGITPVIYHDMPGFGSYTADFYFDAFQLESVGPDVATASSFKEPSGNKTTIFGREITDGKIVTHYGPHYGDSSQWYGPIPNTTPSGLPNPEPHGDFWVNTSNNNILFRYNQDGTDISSQTVYWTTSTIHGSGWYTTEDLRTGNALSTSYDALANAATAQAAADREILAYFEPSAPVASGNGDVWIHTASFATLNTSSIYVAFTEGADEITTAGPSAEWVQSPNSAIGQVYLNAYLAEQKASRAESLSLSVTGSGDLPFPVAPDANGIHVGATGNLVFYRNSSTEYLTDQFGSAHTGQIYVTNRDGVDLVGPNGYIWYPYSSGFGIPEEGTVATNFYQAGATPESLTVSNSTFASLYLMYTNMNAATRFGDGTGTPFGTHDHIIPVRWNNADGQKQWEAVKNNGTYVDFIPDSANGDFLVAELTRPTAVPEGFATLDSWVFKTLPVQTQAITDGKIVTHFGPHSPPDTGTHGPRANLTPTGIYNPDPHGDFWINTSNNNLIFRYHANTTNKWAQTAFHAPAQPSTKDNQSGWYSTEDLRTSNNEHYASNTQNWLTDSERNLTTLQLSDANNFVWINFAFSNAVSANAAAYRAQAAADREINAFFANHDADIPTPTGNGDVWIHIDNAIFNDPDPAIRSRANTDAIFVANTTSSGADYDAPGGVFYWFQSPDNAIGRMYIASYANGIVYTDGRVVTHYFTDDSTSPSPGNGPNPNTTPTGDTNPYPDGDLWVDTGNNNVLYRYRQNTTINYGQTAFYYSSSYTFNPANDRSGWYALEDPRLANNAQYTSNLHIWLSNTHNWASSLEGNTVNNQIWTNFALANAQFANGVAYNANAAAYLAQAAADREILAYFQVDTDVPNATGNGDVWIHTNNLIKSDGTLNTGAIFSANSGASGGDYHDGSGHRWWEAPRNAIGLMYARSYANGVAGEFDRGTNFMPRGWSMFDAPVEQYSNTSPLLETVPYPIAPGAALMWEIVDDQNPPVGGKSFYLQKVSGSGNHGFWATIPTDRFGKGIPIPYGKRWILSWYAKNAAGATSGVNSGIFAYVGNTSITTGTAYVAGAYRGTAEGDPPAGTQNFDGTDWERHWFVMDLTGGSDGTGTLADANFTVGTGGGGGSLEIVSTDRANGFNRIIMRADPGGNGTGVADSPTYYAGFQLEAVSADVYTPSEFKEPSENKGIVFGHQISDGKIVTRFFDGYPQNPSATEYFGPQANVTPTGLPNPEPHGDFWIDTANNNIMFRYHQKDPSARAFNSATGATFAQTAFWVDGGPTPASSADGWYALEDPRTSNTEAWLGTTEQRVTDANNTAHEALQRAASAASAADAEILVFFEPSTNSTMYNDTYSYGHGAGSGVGPATGNGDIWIQIDQVYNPDGTQNTGSIFFANLSPTAGWTQSEHNAIGRAFLDSFTTSGVKNWWPAGYSTWDEEQQNFFGAPVVYNIGIESSQNGDTPYPLTVNQDASIANTVVNTSFGYVSPGSLQLTGGQSDSEVEGPMLWFANTYNRASRKEKYEPGSPSSTLNFTKGKRWIFSYYAYSNSDLAVASGPRHEIQLHFSDTDDPNANVVFFKKSSLFTKRNEWERYSFVLDFSNTHIHANASGYTDTAGKWGTIESRQTFRDGSTAGHEINPWHEGRLANLNSLMVRLDFNQSTDESESTMWFDGFQYEEAPGAQILAGPFSDPDRRISDHFTRAISDGQVVSHYANGAASGDVYYGPRPQVTPSGRINPIPHGDFWIDTANNNAMYRFSQNNSYQLFSNTKYDPVAQTAYWSTVAYEENKTGWYSVADGRMAIIAGNVATAFGEIEAALDQISDLEAAADGEISIYFKPADSGDFRPSPVTDGTYSYGDIWINISDDQKFANGTLNPTSIHRRANQHGGFINEADYRWMPEPDNAIGRVYLSTYAAQNLADSKVTSFFTGNTNGGNEFLGEEGPGGNPVYLYGPRANLTPTGHVNHNPDGDIWINTANNNEMYVYNVNGGGGDGGYKQRVYWASVMADEGWYSAEDLRVAAHDRSLELVRATGGDRLVEVFFGRSTVMQNASGNGDVWIQTDNILNTDGTPNTGAIFVGNTLSTGISDGSDHFWHQEPKSALGRSHLEKLVSSSSKNWISRPFSLFDAPLSDYTTSPDYWHSSDTTWAAPDPRSVLDQKEPYKLGTLIDINGMGGGTDPREARWPEDIENLPKEINSATAGAANTARVEIISDTPGESSNSYISGRALRIFTGQVVDGGITVNVASIWTSTVNTTYSQPFSDTAFDGPGAVEIPPGRKWVFSYYIKSYSGEGVIADPGETDWRFDDHEFPRGVILGKKRRDEDGSSNSWFAGFGSVDYASDYRPDGIEYLEKGLSEQQSGYTFGTWVRRHQFLDLTSSNVVASFGNWPGEPALHTNHNASNQRITDHFNSDGTSQEPEGPTSVQGDYWNVTGGSKAYHQDEGTSNYVLFVTSTASPSAVKVSNTHWMSGGFPGKVYSVVQTQVRANTITIGSGTAQYPRGLDTYDSIGRYRTSDNNAGAIIRWKTTVDTTMGGADGRQTARRYNGNHDLSTNANWRTVYWNLKTIPEWRERMITEVEFQYYHELNTNDKFDMNYIIIGQPGVPVRNEIDALAFGWRQYHSGMDTYIDGMMLEDVTGTDRTTPGPFQPPDDATMIDFSRSVADGKIINFVSNAFHSTTSGPGDHAYGPDPSVTPNGLTNPEPYGDKWISMSTPYKTYMYFSNATNKTSQTAFHAPASKSTTFPAANTHWPFSPTGNNDSGWYEYRDTGSALTQEGFQVALGQVAIGAAHWTEGGQVVLGNLTFDPPNTDGSDGPPLVVTGATEFGPNKELLLNPVPPPDTNLHAHWTFNSMNDDAGVRYIPDVSGRKNHAIVHDFTANQAIFRAHDPAQDVINVSGNHSLYSDGVDDVVGDDNAGGIILGVDGDGNRTTLSDGSKIPLDISQTTGTSGGFNKQTWTLWFKPSSTFAGGERIINRDIATGWGLTGQGSVNKGTDNDELHARWYTHDDNGWNIGSSDTTKWYGNNVHDSSTLEHGGLKLNTWHFMAFTIDYDGLNEQIWLYREGEGLIYQNSNVIPGGTTTDFGTARAIKLLEACGSADGTSHSTDDAARAPGWLDEVRFYNSILTPRNIRYLYMNPTGRPRQLQPRPGLTVKKNHIDFNNGYPAISSISEGGSPFAVNAFAYFHGFDIDGNPADIDPYISFDGNVKTMKRGFMKMRFASAGQGKYSGNTGYVMYNMENGGTAWADVWNNGSTYPRTAPDAYYVFAMPQGANSTHPETWKYHNYNGDFVDFTPDDDKHIIVGEARLANSIELGSETINHYIQSVEAYQFARKPSVVRESYNFTISPSDFIDNFDGGADRSFFANDQFWESRLPGTFIKVASIEDAAIKELAADKIQAGQISVRVTVGDNPDSTADKILLDGKNSRIIISD